MNWLVISTLKIPHFVIHFSFNLISPHYYQVDDVWENFPVAHWRRKRVRLQGENFHCVPHPGEVTPDVSETEAAVAALDVDVAVTNSLVSL